MSKSRRSPRVDREYSKEQKFINENKSLKQEIAQLRKQIARIDLGWCPKCLEKYTPNQELPPKIENMGKKKDRTCFKCHEGRLTVFRYNRAGEQYYFRKCNKDGCGHRTRGKKWEEGVEE
jgi:hypothetical protein